ncbi:MAG TPA: class I SAM-dependent methyltransferase [Chitinophagaceae bacterium]|jgi:2-polyprenyl-3-methyl-5-hydroxy-6-metoxy-1,4-benzoquinol methylase|nr:class I SAM-dependent methyltransferase [Chitinophagaceae bacterium]
MNELKERVDRSANFYNESILDFDYQLAEFNFRSLKPFFKGNLALELGPASGYMTKALVAEFKELHLVEGSKDLLNQIPDYPNVQKTHSLFEDFETEVKYNTIIMSHVLEHIADPVLVLQKVHGWLAEDGVFLVSVPNAKSIHRMVAVQMGLLKSEYELNPRDHELGHYRVYDMNLLKLHLAAAGFKVQESGGVFLKPLSNSQIEKNWNQEMIEGFYKVGKHFQEYCAEIFVVSTK